MFTVRRFACALTLNFFVLSGAMFPDDKKPAPVRDHGWCEKHYYSGNLANTSKRKENVAKLENDINVELRSIPGIECVRVNPAFGKNFDVLFVVRYKIGENKEKKPCSVKLWYVADVSATTPREEDEKDRNKWFVANPDINLTSDADYYYGGQLVTVLLYETTN